VPHGIGRLPQLEQSRIIEQALNLSA
jgi:hypothetical protein